MANDTLRSEQTRNNMNRVGCSPRGIQKGWREQTDAGTAVTFGEKMRRNWEYLPDHIHAKAKRLSTTYKGVEVEEKSGQFMLGL